MNRVVWIAAVALWGATQAAAQGVMVAPTAVFMDHRTRSGQVTLVNPGTDPVEVSISVFYGYTVTDSLGQLSLKTVEQPDSTDPSAAGWLQAFPRRLTVAPHDRQTIRLLATPPPGLKDGEYWARIAFHAKAGQLPVAGVTDTARIKIGLNLEVRTIIGLVYRKGPMQSSIALSDARATMRGDSLEVRARLTRQGNGAYFGTVRGVIVDAKGKTQGGNFKIPITVYFATTPRWMTPVGVLPSGHYWVRLTIAAERDDLAPELLLRSAPVRDSVALVVP
jgi:P pilus assembly chaperone PapD